MLTVEQQVLAAAAVLKPGPAQQRRLFDLLNQVQDGDLLVRMAIREGMAGLLYRNLSLAGALTLLEPSHTEELHTTYQRTALDNLKRTHDLKELLRELDRNGISAVLLKGVALLHDVYEDIGLREMSDIDLWILEEELPECSRVLSELEFIQDPLYPNTHRRGPTTLDLHTHFLGADRIRSRENLLGRSASEIYDSTEIALFDGYEVRCLDQYDQVLHLGLHALKHNMEKLIWMVDILGVVSRWGASEWWEFFERSRELDHEKTVSLILFLLQQLLCYELPTEAADFLESRRIGKFEKAVLKQRVKKGVLPSLAHLIFFSPRRGAVPWLSFVVENLFPRPEILRQSFPGYPRAGTLQLYAMRTLQLLYWLSRSIVGLMLYPFRSRRGTNI